MKQCISCGTELDDKALFCVACGTKQPPQGAKCIQCGASLQPGAKFCAECGAEQTVKKRFCTNCGAELKQGMKFCVECGTPAQNNLPQSSSNLHTVPTEEISKTSIQSSEPVIEASCNYTAECDDDDMYGFVDSDGEWVIEPQFDDASDFCEGFACVCIDDEWGYIKPDGSYLIKPKFDEVCDFREGFACVCVGNKWGYLKPDGDWLIKPKFEKAGSFSEKLAAVKQNGKWGILKPDGEWLVKPKFNQIRSFEEGFAQVELNEKWGFIKTDGKYLVEPKFEWVDAFNEGFAAVHLDGKIGFITLTGSYLVKPIFDSVFDFQNGKASVRINGERWTDPVKEGELYSDGTLLMNGVKTSVHELYNGVMKVKKDRNGKVGFVNNDNEWIIAPKYDNAWDFKSDGIALIEKGGKYGFIKSDGSYLVEPKFDDAQSFSEGFAQVKLNDKYGFINTDGAYLAEPIFNKASYFDHGRVSVELNGVPWSLYPDGFLRHGTRKMNAKTLEEIDNSPKETPKSKTPEETQTTVNRNERILIPFEDPEDGKWGYKDQNGNIALIANFDHAGAFIGDYARVIICGNEMFIDKKGHLCHDRNGTLYESVPETNNETENDAMEDYDSLRPKKKSILGQMAKKAWNHLTQEPGSNTSSSGSSQRSSNVRKVWRCTYIGTISDAPSVLDVPSENSTGRPTGNEFVAALKALGYDSAKANAIAAGGGNHAWKCK